MKCTAFIADLHLDPRKPEGLLVWQRFIDEQIGQLQIEKLYILGDFFTLWIGDDDLSSFNLQIMATLKAIIDKGVSVYLLPGNRDFLLGQKFATAYPCVLLSDPTRIDLYGTPTVLTHGDILCTKDKVMNVFRTLTRGAWCRKTFLFLPLLWRRKIAELIQNISQRARRKEGKSKEILAVDDEAVRQLLLKYQARQIIHGHLHCDGVFSVVLAPDNSNTPVNAKRLVVDEWKQGKGNVLLYYIDGSFEMKWF